MYYHVIVQLKDASKEELSRLDVESKHEVIKQYFIPYIQSEGFFLDGKTVQYEEIYSIKVFSTSGKSNEVKANYDNTPKKFGIAGITTTHIIKLAGYSTEVTENIYNEATQVLDSQNFNVPIAQNHNISKNKVFIVHGHDDAMREKVASFVRKIGLEAIILCEQPNKGKTVIEKLDEYTGVGYGIVLYTACDVGAQKTQKDEPRPRARQNVVLEHGYLMGKIGRSKVCALVENGVETPSDIAGVVYIEIDKKDAWKFEVAKELKAAGIKFDAHKML